MISFSDAWLNLVNVVKSFRPTDVLDILITSFLVYKLITWAKVTRTGQLVKGLLALVIAYFLADWMQLQTMKYAMQYLFSNGLILLAVIFQPNWNCFPIRRKNRWISNGKQQSGRFVRLRRFFPGRKLAH